jgi:hypothetical protein
MARRRQQARSRATPPQGIRKGLQHQSRRPLNDTLGGVLLSHALARSTIAAGGLNCRVRDGNGCTPSAIATKNDVPRNRTRGLCRTVESRRYSEEAEQWRRRTTTCSSATRRRRTSSMVKPMDRLVPVSFTRRRASTPGLSTSWSRRGLMGRIHLGGGLALRCFQRLSRPDVATQRCLWRDNWKTSGPSNPVLSY